MSEKLIDSLGVCWYEDQNDSGTRYLHREDGPAVENNDGTKHWYLNGRWINCSSQEEFKRLIKLKVFW